MSIHKRIQVDPDIMFGKPVIKGTRITVEQILYKLAEGMTPEEVMKDHPHLTIDDIHAAQNYAADVLGNEEIIFGKPISK